MTYVYYDQDLKDISNMPQITSNLNIPQDAIICKSDEYQAPTGYEIIGKTGNFVQVEPVCFSVNEFYKNGLLVKKESPAYYQQWLLACAMYNPPFNFAARAKNLN